ncbi:armadillo-type protein [Favolaschia claudopus]|uniref:Armadillo-type protein n=1 Tax=Favolaschia claudopus TaxID=2862362 RepID=A0AAW0CZ21_9AGAR
MNSPTRPPRPESIYSWWSDSMSIGPTISIHAAARPLMRLMYHRQVRSFIKRTQDTRLSPDLMEICLSYLAYKYISPTTKSLILEELDSRVTSGRDKEVVCKSLEERVSLVSELLASPPSRIRVHTWNILRAISPLDSLMSWVSLPQIFSAFSDADPEICEAARFAFIKCVGTAEGLDYCWDYLANNKNMDTNKWLIVNELDLGIVSESKEDEEKIAFSLVQRWSLVAKLLRSREPGIRRHTWNIIQGAISSYTQKTIESLSNPNPHIRESARSTLTLIVEMSDDSLKTLIESVSDPFLQWSLVAELLRSREPAIRRHAWNVIQGDISSYTQTTIESLSNPNPQIRESARSTLASIVETSDDSLETLIESVPDPYLRWSLVSELLRSREPGIRRHSWDIIQGTISPYTQTTIEFLSDPNPQIREIAQSTLTLIIETSNESLETLIGSVPDPFLQRLSGDIIRRIVIQLEIIHSAEITTQVAAMKGDALTLARLSYSLKGARAICAADFVKYAPKFLNDPGHLRLDATTVLSNMAFHHTLSLTAEVETQLEDLACHPWDDTLRQHALYALLC